MKMEPVESSFIAAIGHDPETGTMRVLMKSGKHYDHPDIPSHRHKALMEAPSVGAHYNQYFRGR